MRPVVPHPCKRARGAEVIAMEFKHQLLYTAAYVLFGIGIWVALR